MLEGNKCWIISKVLREVTKRAVQIDLNKISIHCRVLKHLISSQSILVNYLQMQKYCGDAKKGYKWSAMHLARTSLSNGSDNGNFLLLCCPTCAYWVLQMWLAWLRNRIYISTNLHSLMWLVATLMDGTDLEADQSIKQEVNYSRAEAMPYFFLPFMF